MEKCNKSSIPNSYTFAGLKCRESMKKQRYRDGVWNCCCTCFSESATGKLKCFLFRKCHLQEASQGTTQELISKLANSYYVQVCMVGVSVPLKISHRY